MLELTTADWIELGVAVGTGLLALATFAIVIEARRTRLEERKRRIQSTFRSAIIEQLDNVRALIAANPDRGSDHVGRYLFPLVLRFDAAERLLGTEVMPGDLSAYLLWSIGRCRAYQARVHDTLVEIPRAQERLVDSLLRAQWATLVDEVQVIACLLIGQASREPNLASLIAEFSASPWTRPLPDTPNARTLARAQDLLAPARPSWPAGRWYEPCRERARDEVAAAAAASDDAELAAKFTQAVI